MFSLNKLIINSPSWMSHSVEKKLHVSSPPKLEHESEHVVWFHISNTGQPNKFSLKCEATGDPER
ncbi:hypothetical protein T4B_7578 [Trichinella pseudospiralis]|nr:hypothetical protein T4B_7578 [Trichinella pseudospiralis]